MVTLRHEYATHLINIHKNSLQIPCRARGMLDNLGSILEPTAWKVSTNPCQLSSDLYMYTVVHM